MEKDLSFNTTNPEVQETINLLIPLFNQAMKEGKWFYSIYQGIWFHPKELFQCWQEGKFLWGPVNWKLRNPQEKIKELENQLIEITSRIADTKERMKQ